MAMHKCSERLLFFYIESNIATISNDVGLCFRFGQSSNGSKFVRFSMKVLGGKSFFKMHFAKSLAIREKTSVIRCAVTDFNSILAERRAYSIIIEFGTKLILQAIYHVI